MDIITRAYDYCTEKVKQYPELSAEINSYYSLFRMEISDESASIDNEWELLYSDVEQLIKEHAQWEKT